MADDEAAAAVAAAMLAMAGGAEAAAVIAKAGVQDERRADEEGVGETPEEKPAAVPPLSPKEFIVSVARKITEQAPQSFGPNVWGVLTAISTVARNRRQGMNIILDSDEHSFGRTESDPRYRIDALSVSASHCKIYRKARAPSGFSIFLRDHSTNGTFLNWEKITKNVRGVRMKHGDIVSFVAPPHREVAVAFVYLEMCPTTNLEHQTAAKRKLESCGPESKRPKGLGIGAPEGPVSLDDVRSLQRSNTALRKQLESHVHEIETLHNKNLAVVAFHDQELKSLKETVTSYFFGQIEELNRSLEIRQKELDAVSAVAAERKQTAEDLNERLTVSVQSRKDADEIINNQKSTISELEAQLAEERCQRRKEREKASKDLKSSLEKVKLEFQEELKRQSDVASNQQKELQEVISKLQEADKEGRALVETLRAKLEDTRESLVLSEKRFRQLEAQFHNEQLAAANAIKKAETLEMQTKKLLKEVEREKIAREEAWVKVSALELEISAAIRDLTIEKQRFQGARERIILRETQLRAFYSTTEEIAALFAKQQEQLKAMQKALEDGENCETASVDIDLDTIKENLHGALERERTDIQPKGNTVRGTSSVSNPNNLQGSSGTYSDDDGSATVKHGCDRKSQEDGDTQDMECTSADHSLRASVSDMDKADKPPVNTVALNCRSQEVSDTQEMKCMETDCSVRPSGLEKGDNFGAPLVNVDLNLLSQENGETEAMDCNNADCSVKGFGLDIDVVGRNPVQNSCLNDMERVLVSDSQTHCSCHCNRNRDFRLRNCSNKNLGQAVQNSCLNDTERVLVSDSQTHCSSHCNRNRDFRLRNCSNKNLGQDDVQLDAAALDRVDDDHRSEEQNPNEEGIRNVGDTEVCSIRTADLLTSEVAGSWAINTASDHVGENEFLGSNEPAAAAAWDEAVGMSSCQSDMQAAGSQTHPSVIADASNSNRERWALNQMIGIVAPDMKDQFPVDTENALDSESHSGTEVSSGNNSDNDGITSNKEEDDHDDDDDATQRFQ